MIRYFVLATVIVLAAAIVLGAWWAAQLRKQLTVASVPATTAPRKESSQNIDYGATSPPFIARVPWALSVLPECLQQTMSARGRLAYVTAKIPAGVRRIAPPATMRYADCTIELQGESALVKRGVDRLRIPPKVEFFAGARNRLFVLREDSAGAELRVYVPSR